MNGHGHLSDADIAAIRELHTFGCTCDGIADIYGVTVACARWLVGEAA
jgi:hypothetical protein